MGEAGASRGPSITPLSEREGEAGREEQGLTKREEKGNSEEKREGGDRARLSDGATKACSQSYSKTLFGKPMGSRACLDRRRSLPRRDQDLLVSSSCDITGHCSPLGLDTRPRCQATAVKGLSVNVCAASAYNNRTSLSHSITTIITDLPRERTGWREGDRDEEGRKDGRMELEE
ncbi:unnamed protein product [Pleuronectes platessa]|uniref:Uncharacterized protein n=1 Tax=Pleuronectes platessa TaxID=8262 RepID=A0A9N7U9S6_PLEPL|nr:unnamed protein product [Pleuronectes platessa]